ncbi:MAG TPA: hypothetical protein VFX13_02000 [Gaiellales bacterium]|nr:hypothetical protein [Gaiellales bacterium]
MSRIESLNELRGDFVRLAEAERRRAQTHRRRVQPRLPALVAAAALAWALAFGLVRATMQDGAGTSATGGAHTRPIKGHGATSPLGGSSLEALGSAAFPLPPIGADPFVPAGRHVSLERAQEDAGYPLPIPRAPAANPTLLSDVWITRNQARWEVALQYRASGVRLFMTPAPRAMRADPVVQLEARARELDLGRHAVRRIAGSAVLIQPSPGLAGGPTALMISQGGREPLEIAIIGSSDTSIASLVAITRSLAAASAAGSR